MKNQPKQTKVQRDTDLTDALIIYIPFARQIGERIAVVRARQKKASTSQPK